MHLHELIAHLQEIKRKHNGNLEVMIARTDPSGNTFFLQIGNPKMQQNFVTIAATFDFGVCKG